MGVNSFPITATIKTPEAQLRLMRQSRRKRQHNLQLRSIRSSATRTRKVFPREHAQVSSVLHLLHLFRHTPVLSISDLTLHTVNLTGTWRNDDSYCITSHSDGFCPKCKTDRIRKLNFISDSRNTNLLYQRDASNKLSVVQNKVQMIR
jgi:hypothetical protein